jgi:2',3'-cyclic-nucleotide 2'-phosphodiesterase (5'-nucleotidase family)
LQDVSIAKRLFALSPRAQKETDITSSHGVDLILGGHDHIYYISKGVTSWENYELSQPVLGAEEDEGDVLVVKSGNDFRDLSELALELEPTSPGSVRTHVIAAINGMNCTASLG